MKDVASVLRTAGCRGWMRVLAASLLLAVPLSAAAWQPGKDGAVTVSTANTVVNAYTTITVAAAQNATSITVGSATGISAGDVLLLYSAQGATISTANTAAYGAVTNLGSAGRLEFVNVVSVSGTTISVDSGGSANVCGGGLRNAYPNGTQVVRAPQYTTLTISGSGSVVAQAWNGSTGGIVAAFVQNAATINGGGINVAGQGFRGGALINRTGDPGTDWSNYVDVTATGVGAEKGESIAGYQASYDAIGGRYSRGAPANGGGGGNSHNGGGGGGANGDSGTAWNGGGNPDTSVPSYVTAWNIDPTINASSTSSGGGRGGYTYASATNDPTTAAPGNSVWGGNFRRERGGLGGRPLTNDPSIAGSRLFFGGGGGAGDENNGAGSVGGNGGGLVFLVADTINGSGTIDARGATATDTISGGNDAPGGGGAGGSVVLIGNTSLGGVNVKADGGKGGNQIIATNESEGAGGGGGGGYIALRGGAAGSTSAAGGVNGTSNSAGVTPPKFPPNGATKGAGGIANATAPAVSGIPLCTIPGADLQVVKTGPASVTANGPISYSVVVTNLGPSDASGAAFSDPVPAAISAVTATCGTPTGGAICGTVTVTGNNVTSTISTLPANGSVTFTISGTAPANAAPLTNTATITAPSGVTDPNTGNNSSSVGTTVNASADLSVVKTGPANAVPGATVSYTLAVANAGPSDATAVSLADPTPAGLTFVSASTPCAAGFPCNLGTLTAGANASITVIYSVPSTYTGNIVNTATVSSPTPDPVSGNNTSTVTTPTTPIADIAVAKTGPASIGFGGALSYTVVVTNNGPSSASGTTFSDPVPAGITGITASCGSPTGGAVCGAANVAGSSVTSTITTLPAGSSVTFTINGTAPTSGTSITNSATAQPPGTVTDPTPGNNTGSATTNLLQPQLTVTKTASPTPFVVGQAAAYTITVKNTGAGPTVGAITIADPLPTGLTLTTATGTNWTCAGTTNLACTFTGTLAASASTVLTLNVSVAASAVNGNNTATASGGGDSSCPAAANCVGTVTVPVTPSADLSILKSGPPTLASGATITYALLISNAGPSAGNGATWSDNVPAAITSVSATCGTPTGGAVCAVPVVAGNNVSGTVPTLPSGGSVTITITGTAPFGAQTLNNTATVTAPSGVTDPNPGNNSSSVSTTIGSAADIAVTKTVDNTTPNVGQTVTYTITAINDGPNDATNVALTDSLPSGLSFVSATPSQGTYVSATGLWTIGALTNGSSVTLTLVATVDQPGGLTNTVAVSASDQPDPNTSNNNAGAAINAGASADISVAKTVDNATPNVGSSVTYTITAKNNGPNDATGIAITDNLPTGVTFISATPSAAYNAASGVWTVGALVNGASATLAITVNVDQPGSIMNTATITHEDQFDPVGANNQAGVTINGQQADLAVTKTVDNATPNVGSNVNFTVTVHNNGPSDATNVALTDNLPVGLQFVSAAPSQGVYSNVSGIWTVGTLTAAGATSTATMTVVAKVTQSGALTNTASVSASDQPDPNSTNNSASAALNGNPQADLAVTKSGPATVTPGNNVVYTVMVTNNGPSPAANVVITDPTPAGLTFVSNSDACTSAYPCTLVSLASGASATITSTYSVPANYAGANPIVNTASASSDTPDPDTTNNQASASTNVGPGNADLSVVKTGPATVASGGSISWTLTITNNGPSPANGAAYSDTVPAGITAISASCGGENGGAACTTQPTIAGSTVSGTVGSLPSGGSVVVTINGTAPTGPLELSNTATVAPPTGINDPNPANNSSTVVTNVGAPSADLSVVKTGPASVAPGTQVTYTLAVTNAGPDTAVNTILNDPTPGSLTFVSASMPCQGGFPCALGDMLPDGSTMVTVTFAVAANASGSIINSATVNSDTPDPNLNNNASSVTIPVVPTATSADLSIVKSGPASTMPGTSITYSLQVTNNGPDPATNVTLADPTPPGLTFVSASAPCAAGFPCALGTFANSASTTVTVTFTVAANASGSIANTATVGSDTPDPNGNNNSSTVTTTIVPILPASADLAVTKAGPASAVSGSTVSYTITVANNGPDAVPDAVLADPTPAGLTFVSASAPCASGFPCTLGALANGASATVTVSYTVNAGFTGSVTNIASANSATVPDPTPNNNASTVTTTVSAGGNPGGPVTPVPVDARWMLALMTLLLMLLGAPLAMRRR